MEPSTIIQNDAVDIKDKDSLVERR